MTTEVIMPKAGMAMEEGTVIKWLKDEGGNIKKGEAILEIHTDKVNMEVEAEVSGILLKKVANEGDILPVFTTLGYIGEEGEEIVEKEVGAKNDNFKITENKNLLKNSSDKKVIQKEDLEKGLIEKIRATPLSRKLCKENNVILSDIKGTGPKERVQAKDVEKYLESKKRSVKKVTPLAENIAKAYEIDIQDLKGSGVNGKVMKSDVMKVLNSQREQLESIGGGKLIPLTEMRKIIGCRMSESYFTAPTFTLNIDVNMTKVIKLRKKIKDLILEETGSKLTFTDFIVLASIKALEKYPIVNASLVEEGILIHNDVNIALAVGLDEGLLVPVIRRAQNKSLSEIVQSRKRIIEKANSNKLLPKEMEESTFTISNLGMFDITHFNPIINQPNSAILGVGSIDKRVVVIEEEPTVRSMMSLSLTIDHRVIDGMPGAKFLQYIKRLLEDPMKMLI